MRLDHEFCDQAVSDREIVFDFGYCPVHSETNPYRYLVAVEGVGIVGANRLEVGPDQGVVVDWGASESRSGFSMSVGTHFGGAVTGLQRAGSPPGIRTT